LTNQDIEKLKRNNLELQEIINNSWDGIGIIDENTKFIYINNAFMPILGFSKEELLSTNFSSLMEDKFKESFLNLLKNTDKSKKYKAEIDLVCKRKDKKRVYLKITISTMLNNNLFVINTKDITSQISDDEILNDYVISMHTDLHGHITKASSAFCKLSGYDEKELVGKSFSSLAHRDSDLIIYKNILSNLENFQEWSGKLKKLKKDGSTFWINLRAKPIYNKYGDVTGYTYLMFDITEEINLNDSSSLLKSEISKAKDEIEQKDKLLLQKSKLAIMTETLQMLSHEWRQPLNLISIQAQKLEINYSMNKNPSKKETISTLETIHDEAIKLSNTIESFQKFLQLKNQKEEISFDEILSQAIEKIGLEYDIKDIIFEKKIKKDLIFKSLKNELIDVLINIIKNSIEAFDKNKITKKKIKINQNQIDDKIIIEISDNAKGINEDIIHQVFEPYFSTKEQKHGVGLGLYMSKIIVNIHLNGIITAKNNTDGTTIKISLPYEK
jgi:PAS domain S-box-containing protein